MNPIFGRMVRALSFDERLYSEIGGDPRALTQAGMIVILGAIAHTLGIGVGDLTFMLLFSLRLLVWWLVLSVIISLVGTRLFPPLPNDYGAGAPGPDIGKIARVLGFAMSPRLFRVLAFVPTVGPIAFYLVTFWQIALMLMAVRETFGYASTTRAAYVVGVGVVPLMFLEPFILGGV